MSLSEADKKYHRDYYAKTRATRLLRKKANKAARAKRWKTYKESLACVMCGESHPAIIQFHHTNPEEKDFTLGDAIRMGIGESRVLEEIHKCLIVCANCHAKIHYVPA